MAFSVNFGFKDYQMTAVLRRSLFVASISLSIILTCVLYKPVSLIYYKIKEPYFSCPIRTDSGKIEIRNDAYGDGEFGAKRKNGRTHAGIDIRAPVGTPVYASKSGMAFRIYVPTGYGRYVMIYHPDGYQTIYAHLSEWKIPPATKIRMGQIIGLVGKTGNASNKRIDPHLHFEIRKDGQALDPREDMR